jgi:aminoglycoside 6'-N-acetyltransferase
MPPDVGFRPVTSADYPLLLAWLRAPHVREWWGDPEEELDSIRDMVEGRDTTRPYVIELAGRAIGYIQLWFVDDNVAHAAEYPWIAELPPGTVGVDISIGDSALLSRGIGSAALAAFTRRLRAEGHETIVIDPDPANVRAVRAYAKAGFRPIPRLQGRTGGALIMQHHPEAT